jgi:hypothetical protein
MPQRGVNGSTRRTHLFAICCCMLISGCVSQSVSFDSVRPLPAYDSSRRSVADISSGVIGWMSLPHRDLIRVDFTSGTDLRNMVARDGNVLYLHSYFCDAGDLARSTGDPGVYVDLADARAETVVNQFIFFIDVTRRASPGSTPPEPGYDLAVKAEDICFYVTAHGVTATHKSSVGRIPKAAIEQVLEGWGAR